MKATGDPFDGMVNEIIRTTLIQSVKEAIKFLKSSYQQLVDCKNMDYLLNCL